MLIRNWDKNEIAFLQTIHSIEETLETTVPGITTKGSKSEPSSVE